MRKELFKNIDRTSFEEDILNWYNSKDHNKGLEHKSYTITDYTLEEDFLLLKGYIVDHRGKPWNCPVSIKLGKDLSEGADDNDYVCEMVCGINLKLKNHTEDELQRHSHSTKAKIINETLYIEKSK